MLRRVAEAMGATVHIVFESSAKTSSRLLTQSAVSGRVGKKCRV
jgi:hypothetical protein